ncbi:MAG: peptidylprolyl isomerase [Longimicrobiales bacterium]
MMRKMRDHMKWIMAVTAITFVALMVFGWGMDITGRSSVQATGGELGRVNGEPITYQEWDRARRNLYDQQQRATNAPVSAAMNKQLEQAAWDQLVMQKLINQELGRRGIGVTDAEIRQMARFAPPQEFMTMSIFQTNGQFDLTKYQSFLATQQANDTLLLQLEGYYRDVIPRSKLFYQTTAGAHVPEAELWRMWRDARETARVRYIFFDPSAMIPDNQVTVPEREMERYYNDHLDQFEKPARARVRYVVVDRTPNAADSAAALARVQRILEEIVGGAKFEDVARRESADSVSREQGGDLGKVPKGRAAPAFDNAVFSLPIGRLSEPVKTQFGYHLIEVKSRTADEAEVRHILIPFGLSPERDEALITLADSLDDLGATGTLEAAARQLSLIPRTADLEPGLSFLPGIGQPDEGAVWALDQAEIGEVSEVFESPNAYYMMELLERTEAGTQTLQEARPVINARLMQDKKLEAARAVARRAADVISGGGTLEQAAQAVGLKVQESEPFSRVDFVSGMGRSNAAIGTAFGLNIGQISGVVEAEGALFILQTTAKTPANRQEFDKQKTAQQAQFSQQLGEQRWNQFLRALRDDAKIVDNREQLLRPATTTTNQ